MLRKIASFEEDQLGDTSTLADPGVVQVSVHLHCTLHAVQCGCTCTHTHTSERSGVPGRVLKSRLHPFHACWPWRCGADCGAHLLLTIKCLHPGQSSCTHMDRCFHAPPCPRRCWRCAASKCAHAAVEEKPQTTMSGRPGGGERGAVARPPTLPPVLLRRPAAAHPQHMMHPRALVVDCPL